jgi:hypothetical protein
MEKFYQTFILAIVCVLILTVSIFCGEQLRIQGFYLGMTPEETETIYEGFKANKTAEHISMEREDYRIQIKLDNEFSSMGNKIEVAFDDSLRANSITFQYKTVPILFDFGMLDTPEFVEKFRKTFKLGKMEFKDMGVIKNWRYENKEEGYKITIENQKNVRLQVLKK